MQRRQLGKTGLQVSVLSFGCGAVGGLMVRGAPPDQQRAVARAIEAGINYFDTAPAYGNGASEQNLGRVLAVLKPDVFIGTKVRIPASARGRIGGAVTASLDASLRRLGRDSVDLFQLHNALALQGAGESLTPEEVLGEVVPAFERLRAAGKTRFIGFTAVGETEAMQRLVAAHAFDTAQVCFNALNPTAGMSLPADYPAQDYGLLLERAREAGMGTIGIRVMAAGALSGSDWRHPIAAPEVAPIGSGVDYKADVARAQRLEPLLRDGHAQSLPELALRFAISHAALSTTLIGLANLEQLDAAIAAVEKGPLSPAAQTRLRALQRDFAGETR